MKTNTEEEKLDAESACRRKQTTAKQHLEHLLRIGYEPDSSVIRNFKQLYNNELNMEGSFK